MKVISAFSVFSWGLVPQFFMINSPLMKTPRTSFLHNDFSILILLALARLILHTVTNGQYGFHRDELAMLDDARVLDVLHARNPALVCGVVARDGGGGVLAGGEGDGVGGGVGEEGDWGCFSFQE